MSAELEESLPRRASVFAALADPARLRIVDRLLLSDASPSEVAAMLGMPSNLVAHHLKVLEAARVVSRTRSQGDRRRTYLSVDLAALEAATPRPRPRANRVVFVCTENSARSQLAVAIWDRHGVVPAASAGTHPAAVVHPDAVSAARRHRLALHPKTPRHVDDVLRPGDLVVAVCDGAHEYLPADLARIHWSVPDPTRRTEPDAFDRALAVLSSRIDRLLLCLQPSSNGVA